MRYVIILSYDGSAFCGWQRQKEAVSVQQKLEEALCTLLGGEISVVGAGRTDTGVNAMNYAAHFDLPGKIADCRTLCYKLNAILPHEIAVSSVSEADEDFHARFSAKKREYTYYLHRKKDPFLERYSYLCGYPVLDFDKMNLAASFLIGTHDFKCFEKKGSDNKTSICTIYEAGWFPVQGNVGTAEQWAFRIVGDRFLRNMVRAIVGTLIEVGRLKRSPLDIPLLLEGGSRSDSGESVPGNALFLTKIEY